ncbi:hypothetical protein LSTR_LSTR017566 [Laodelphax striatellus]|uniref:ubiquitinyl hydrolase 1 n=1 Tax=Laodelphax striatellus TaxID=195883 RepID=A0A482WM61_LAOST|nr:hypothetical protein LSTR_LSTR017566 [Laodelphax striatellus]
MGEEFPAALSTAVNIPENHHKIYKDECVYSFDCPESDTGLYVCLSSFLGLGRDHVERFHKKTGHSVFLHIKRVKIDVTPKLQGDGPEKKVTRLAIGIEGGFTSDTEKKYEIKETLSIVVLPGFVSHPYPSANLPERITKAVEGILQAESAFRLAEKEALMGQWDGEARIVSKHANNLLQLDNGKKIPPSGWKCEKCDLNNNLWLNLSDGTILCGRKFFDGSGGNNHAIEHYKEAGYPLAVKLGTITKEGAGDVYSYDEDDMVEDPNLIKHLAHWGINIAQMEKTDKSMVELELDLNQRVGEWATLQENSSQLKPVYGPGCTGMINLGNSCYVSSLMQVIFCVPDFVRRFVDNSSEIFDSNVHDPASDFNIQMAKLGHGLLSGKYSQKPPEPTEEDRVVRPQGIAPIMFKTLIGKGHPDFSTKKQQDVLEFLLHFITILQRNSRHQLDPSEAFKFQVVDRFQCTASRQVKYTSRTEYCLPVPVPLEAAVNKAEVDTWTVVKAEAEAKGQKVDLSQQVRPHIKLSSCFDVFTQVETVEQFYSTALKDKTTAHKTTRLSTLPDYLFLHLKKFTLAPDWTPVKLDVSVDMPAELDLATLRGKAGLQPGEEALPEESSDQVKVQFDEGMLSALVDMGFPVEAVKKALFFTESRGLEAATEWIMQHIADDDFQAPFVPPGLNQAADKGKLSD